MVQREGTKAPRRTAATPRRAGTTGQARYDEIVQIAGRLFAERGFLATTIRDIADAANILSGSLYHHFASKESIADELQQAYWRELLAAYDAVVAEKLEPVEALRGLITVSIRMLERHEYAVRMILNDWSYLSGVLPYLEQNMVSIRKVWTTQLRLGIKAGDFRAGMNPDVTYRTIMGSITGTGRWFSPGGKLSSEQLANQMADLFLLGLAPER